MGNNDARRIARKQMRADDSAERKRQKQLKKQAKSEGVPLESQNAPQTSAGSASSLRPTALNTASTQPVARPVRDK